MHRSPEHKIVEYPLFDWLRFVLASAVVLVHCDLIRWSPAGNLAVQCFFALSGWLIGSILLRTDSAGIPRFFFNRATRIWIPYAAAILLVYGFSSVLEPVNLRRFEFMLYDVTFTRNWFGALPDEATAFAQMPFRGIGGHFWSICVEEQFYLIAPLALILLPRAGRSPRFWTALALVLTAAESDFAAISFGVLAATLNQTHKNWHLGRWGIISLACVFGLAAIGLAISSSRLFSPIFSISLVLLAARPGKRSSVSEFFGGISYPIYLNHWLGGFVAHSLLKHVGLFLSWEREVTFFFGLIVGATMYLAIDQVVLQYRSNYYNKRRGMGLALIAYGLLSTGISFGIFRWFILRP
jgi:peptidoglycan/LPS O-acetylase OafA/YrhL